MGRTNNRLTSIVIVCFLFTAGFIGFITFESNVVSAATIYVGSGFGNHTASIQDAIDNYANDGDTVYVHSGIYFENVVVNKTINLTGEDKNDTMIYGNGSGDVVTIVVDWVNVSGFTITNGGGDWGDSGIELINVINCEIFNNNVSINNWTGIYLDFSSGNNIIGNNLFFNSWDGIHLRYSSGNNITGNNLFLNHEDGIFLLSSNENYIADNNASNNNDGIDIMDSSDNIVENNTFISNSAVGIRLWRSNWNNIIINNTCLKNGIVGVWFSDSSGNKLINNNASNNNFAGIELYPNSNSNNITGNIVSSNSYFGIRLLESEGNNFTGNNVSSNLEHGIYLWFHSNRNTVIGNNVTNNGNGIYLLDGSDNNSIVGNNVSFNNEFGIGLFSSTNTIIESNNVSNNRDGIYIDYFYGGNDIEGNTISSNSRNGIFIYWYSFGNNITGNVINNNLEGINISSSSNNNMITGNNISNNGNGIAIDYSYNNTVIGNAFYLNSWYGIDIRNEDNNTIYHNNFISNNGGGVQARDNTGTNYWNDIYPSGGNYWNDWTTPDIKSGPNQDQPGSDGFVDIPYYLDGGVNARDRYPFGVPEKLILSPPVNLTTKVVNNGNNVELEWKSPFSPTLDHYLIYRADSATAFDFAAPYNSSTTWPNPKNTTWVDPDLSVTSVDDDLYYIVRAANFDESVVSLTSNTAGVWTRTFQGGISTFSLPLEPFVKKDTEFYCQDMNASYIKWMNTTTHTWMRHDRGSSENNSLIEIGKSYEIGFLSKSIQTKYTFTGMPGALILYDNIPFGFDATPLTGNADSLMAIVDSRSNVTLNWTKPTNIGLGDRYYVLRSTSRDGFWGTLGLNYTQLAVLPFDVLSYQDIGNATAGTEYYYMILPVNSSTGKRGVSSYSIGVWTAGYLDQYDTFAVPLRLSSNQTADWYCDNIPETVGINYFIHSQQRWGWHSTRMPAGAYDPMLEMAGGYQISTSGPTKFTFIGV